MERGWKRVYALEKKSDEFQQRGMALKKADRSFKPIKITKVGKKMTPTQIAVAQRLASAWTPK